MALTATIYSFDVRLADVDRGVYESIAFKAAQHRDDRRMTLELSVVDRHLYVTAGDASLDGPLLRYTSDA